MKRLLPILMLLCGCATSAEIYLPDGRKGHNINCPGSGANWGHCFTKASEICGARGYEVVNRDGAVVPFATSTGSGSMVAGGIVTRTLIIACKL